MKYIILYNAHLHTFASFELVSVFQIRLVLQKAPSCSDTGVCHNLPTYFEIRRLCQFTAGSQPIHGLFTHFNDLPRNSRWSPPVKRMRKCATDVQDPLWSLGKHCTGSLTGLYQLQYLRSARDLHGYDML